MYIVGKREWRAVDKFRTPRKLQHDIGVQEQVKRISTNKIFYSYSKQIIHKIIIIILFILTILPFVMVQHNFSQTCIVDPFGTPYSQSFYADRCTGDHTIKAPI